MKYSLDSFTFNKPILSFFGPPGSGKGTLAHLLVLRDSFQMLSTGNLCRDHVTQESEFGRVISCYLKSGLLIPDDLITEMVIDWLKSKADPNKPVILDGFPRTDKQASSFLNFLKSHSIITWFRVFLVELSDTEILARLSKRMVCSNSKCQNPAILGEHQTCKICGASLVRREDDTEYVAKERLASYATYKKPLLNFYENNNITIYTFSVSGLNIEQVYQNFKKFS